MSRETELFGCLIAELYNRDAVAVGPDVQVVDDPVDKIENGPPLGAVPAGLAGTDTSAAIQDKGQVNLLLGTACNT